MNNLWGANNLLNVGRLTVPGIGVPFAICKKSQHLHDYIWFRKALIIFLSYKLIWRQASNLWCLHWVLLYLTEVWLWSDTGVQSLCSYVSLNDGNVFWEVHYWNIYSFYELSHPCCMNIRGCIYTNLNGLGFDRWMWSLDIFKTCNKPYSYKAAACQHGRLYDIKLGYTPKYNHMHSKYIN